MMEIVETKFDLKAVKKDLLHAIRKCSERGLLQSTKWLSEINYCISHIKLSPEDYPDYSDSCNYTESYLLAKSFLDVKEYDRCAHFTTNCTDEKSKFLHYYSKYLSIEKKKLDYMADCNYVNDSSKNEPLRNLCRTLNEENLSSKLDGFTLYLYGVVLKKLELNSLAMEVFVNAINEEPLNWGAWHELAVLVPDKNTISSLQLPEHWMKSFFLGVVHVEQLNSFEAIQIYTDLLASGFENSTHIRAQLAISYHNCRDLEKAIVTFKDLMAIDPCRLDNLDTLSNLMYVTEMKNELGTLAHTALNIDKYRVETCCIIGNYYSLRLEHHKAILYFQRALKLNPQYLSAWTLMGHEFMELKNTNAAIHSYRQAVEVNRRDYRAWYGLGQTYEILKMPMYCVYYYKQAHQLRPNDSRMLIALGETYEKLEKNENALKCFYKAFNIGDVEGMALLKLAKLYEKLNEEDNAAAAYTEYCLKQETYAEIDSDVYFAFQYLANYHLKKGELNDANTYAYKCLEYNETKEQAKAILKTIAARRGEEDLESQSVRISHDQSEPNITSDISHYETSMDIILSPPDNNRTT